MKLIDAYQIAIKLLKRQAKDSPSKSFTTSNGEQVTISDVADSLSSVLKWIHPELCSEEITLVTRCKNCKHYKRFKKKGDLLKPRTFYACVKDRQRRSPEFFCKDGEKRDL